MKKNKKKKFSTTTAKTTKDTKIREINFIRACNWGEVEPVRKLIQDGANVNTIVQIGLAGKISPLSVASSHGDYDLVKLLIDSGADVNAPVENGMTPLMTACLTKFPKIVELLIQHGADENKKNINGHTAHDLLKPFDCYMVIGEVNYGHEKETEQALINSIEERDRAKLAR